MPHRVSLLLLGAALLGTPTDAQASCGLDGAVREQLRHVGDLEAARALSRKISLQNTCSVCHLAGFGGPRNEYGNAINTLLRTSDRDDPVRQRDAGRRMKDVLANPLVVHSPTFGELFQQGRFPTRSLTSQDPPLPEVRARASENVTVQQARELVQEVEAESRFGILQLSRTYEITPAVAEALAEFRGEMLILGLKTLSLEVAAALAKSQAANVWLHSVTSVSPAASEAIVKLRGHLVLTSLAELESVPLAEKLAARPGALSFPYLTTISPEIAAALARNERSLTLAGLTDVPTEVQEKLAETVGGLSLPNLTSLDSLPLAKKLAEGMVLLPKVEKLSAEQVRLFTEAKFVGSFFGGIYLSLAAVTPAVADALAETPRPIRLTLFGSGPISDEVLSTLLNSPSGLTLQDIETLTAEQVRIIAAGYRKPARGVLSVGGLSLPSMKRLESALLAETLDPSAFPGVTEISPEAAAALGNLPDAEYTGPELKKIIGPGGDLSFPSLRELSPEVARLLLKKRWLSISLPALQDVSLETVRNLARQTFRLTLGIPALPPEFAGAFEETPTEMTMGGGYITFPYLNDLSPEAARILVKSLNRGVQERDGIRFSKSPRLNFGGDSGLATLSPALAVELAKYEGNLAIDGLGELPDESAAALASFPGPNLFLSGPAAEKLSPEAAESLATVPGVLRIHLRKLDSVPLAERFARQLSWTLSNVEIVSKEAAPALSQYKQFFDLRALTVLESPEMAKRFVEGTTSGTGITLPALANLSPEAADILAGGAKPLYLGLTVLDSPEVARALTKSQQGVRLPRLRAATAEVIAILKESKSIETPALELLYVLFESNVRP